jgi:hypothetical protein
MPFSPGSATVNWYEDFDVTVNVVSTSSDFTVSVDGNSVTETLVDPVPTSLTVLSVTPEKVFPPDPTVVISITSPTTFSISGIYKNVMGTEHSWKDNDDKLQTSIIPPDPGTYKKITQVVSPPIQNKTWKYKVKATNDNVITATIFTTSTSITSDNQSILGTIPIATSVQTGTTLISVVTPPVETIGTTVTIISTNSNWVTTSTVAIDGSQKNVVERRFTETRTLRISTSTETKGAASILDFDVVVKHTTYDVVRDKILDPLAKNQPEV